MKSLRINFLITLILIISVQLTNGQSNSARISNYDISAVLDTTTGQLNVRARLSIEKSDSAQLLTLMFGSMAHLDSVIGDYDGSPLNIPFQSCG